MTGKQKNALVSLEVGQIWQDEYGLARIIGIVEIYVVWRRTRAMPGICTAIEFRHRFEQVMTSSGAPLKT